MNPMSLPSDFEELEYLEPVDVPDATVPNVGDDGMTTIISHPTGQPEGLEDPQLEPTTSPGIIANPQSAMDNVWKGFLILMGLVVVLAVMRHRVI